jgi:hypothetical protein
MKNILKGTLLTLFLALPGILFAASVKEGNVVTKTAQGIDFTQAIDVSDVDALSMQAVYSDGTPGSHVINSGALATGNITVSNFASLVEKKAQVLITVSSQGTTGILTGAVITINGAPFREGIEWAIGASSVATGKNISDAINVHTGLKSTHTLSGTAVVTASASAVGSFYNSYTVVSSTAALTVSAATLLGGQDNAVIQFPSLGVIMTQGTDFFAQTSNAVTALNISTSINSHATLGSLIISSRPALASILYASATANGNNNYPISVSTPTSLTVSGFGLSGGIDAEISSSTDRISHTNHFLTTGLAVLFSTAAGSTAPGGLTHKTTYYAIYIDTNTYQLASSTTNAAAGTAIDITSVPVTFSTYTIQAATLTVAGGNGFYWAVSNDGTNFTNITGVTIAGVSVASVTYSAAGNTVWDFQRFGYKYLQAVFKAPTRGGIALTVKQYGKKD